MTERQKRILKRQRLMAQLRTLYKHEHMYGLSEGEKEDLSQLEAQLDDTELSLGEEWSWSAS